MSGLYFPQGFITALLQTHARKYKISIDTLKFDFVFSDIEWDNWEGKNIGDATKEPSAAWIHGLYLDCGFFDKSLGKLLNSKEGLLYPKLPYVRFIPAVEQKTENAPEA